jgi:anthranilate phosphoribosyltransferase
MAEAASLSYSQVIADLERSRALDADGARRVFDAIFAGEWNPTQIAGLLVALRVLGETPEVVCAAAAAMRARMVCVDHALPLVFDTCGTGGDGQGTLNVSTGAALIVAGAGVPVAKHGNRAASSRSGSADVLGALGIPLDLAPSAQGGLLARNNIAFLFAPAHHPAMKHANPARLALGVRTIFNVLGPLANPARATHQLVGAFSDGVRGLMARALRELGSRSAWVVHSEDGLDEISPYAPTRVSVVSPEGVRERSVTPEDFGLQRSPAGALAGGDPEHNAGILQRILAGEKHPARSALLLNAAASLAIARGLELRAATALAESALVSGAALKTLETWRELARAMAPGAATAPSPGA